MRNVDGVNYLYQGTFNYCENFFGISKIYGEIILMPDSYRISIDADGRKVATIMRPLNSGEAGKLSLNEIKDIEINDSKGWQGGSIRFLGQMQRVRSLKVLALLHPVADLEAIQELRDLEELQLHTYCQTSITFVGLNKLSKCNLIWRKGCESLFDCLSLRDLCLIKYNLVKLPIHRLASLRKLHLLQSRLASLDFMVALKELTHMTLGAVRGLEDTSTIEVATKLVRLDIDSCSKGLSHVNHLAKLEKLEFLCLNDLREIKSLLPLEGHLALRSLFFWGSTKIIDGKVDFLRHLPRLKHLQFQNRRNYDCRCESFPQCFNQYTDSVEQ